MRLLFAIKSLQVQGGGAERVLSEVSGGLAARGHELCVVSYDTPGTPDFYDFSARIERIRLAVGSPDKPAKAIETLARMRVLRALALDYRPDVAIGFMHSLYVPMGLALIGTGIPFVASEHISYDHFVTRPLQARLLRLAPALTAVVTIISEPVRAGFPPPLARHMTVIPNPVSVRSERKADVIGIDGRRRIVLNVGRFAPQKDQRTLVAAFATIAGDFPDWDLKIVGDGPLRGELDDQIKALGLVDRIFLPGPTADIGAEYLAAQLFALPSLYESFGLVTAEALAHGLPVIGFQDCPGTNEVIRPEENGLLVTGSERVSAFSAGLARLMRSSALRERFAAAGPPSVAEFTAERVIDRWDDLLAGVAAGSKSG